MERAEAIQYSKMAGLIKEDLMLVLRRIINEHGRNLSKSRNWHSSLSDVRTRTPIPSHDPSQKQAIVFTGWTDVQLFQNAIDGLVSINSRLYLGRL